jgi:diamine N-acetyltransferase
LVFAYRPATPSDALNLSVLATQVFLDTYATSGINSDLAYEASTVYARSVFESRLLSPSASLILAISGEHLVGFVDIDFVTRCPAPEVIGAEVARLYVQRPFMRMGVGSTLMLKAETAVQAHGHSSIWLTAWTGNENALKFYKALDYRDVGTTEYVIEGKSYENRVLSKRLGTSEA